MNYENWNKIDLFIDMEEDPLKKYHYFKIDFTEFNYIFIIPETLSNLFSSFYSKILKDSLIFFPKDIQQAKELLKDYENEEGNKRNWIIISPCMELKNYIPIFNENNNIYCFIGYCPIFNHVHDTDFLQKFTKYYGIVNSYRKLIKKLFKLNNIIYYRKKFKYDINNNSIIHELKNETNFFIDLNNDCPKKYIIEEKKEKLFNFKIEQNKCFFSNINSINLLNKCLENKNYNLLITLIEKLGDIIIISDNHIENKIFASIFLKNLHLLYLYFSNYPYLYGVLTDEEINQILLTFKPDMNKNEIKSNIIFKINSLINIVDTLSFKVDKGISILNENEKLKNFQRLLIEISFLIDEFNCKYNVINLSKFYQIKNYIRDIDFCVGKVLFDILNTYCNNYPLLFKIIYPYIYNERRYKYYLQYSYRLKDVNINIGAENEKECKALNKAIKYNDTVVIGDKNFHNLIIKMNLPCKNKYYINENEIVKFFQNPKKIKNKYNICKYFFLMNENGIKYFETIKYISSIFAFKVVIIIYVENKNNKFDKKLLQVPILPTILTYSEKDILNYYIDNYERLFIIDLFYEKEEYKYVEKLFEIDYKFPKINESKIFKEEDNGWDMKRDVDINIFKYGKVHKAFGGLMFDDKSIFKVYKENNCLDLYINYYSNYFGTEYIVENQVSTVALVKMFLYAYTLEEENGKSFYSLINNDLRSGDYEKISRYLPMIRIIYSMIKEGNLKRYTGDVYRATYFEKELINEIKPGKKMINVSFWSSSKKVSVAKDFLFKYKKNVLLHTKIQNGNNNIDIHLEKISQFPSEEEILFLPYCYFEIKSFKKIKENNFEYYSLELIYCNEENINNKIENVKIFEVI